MADQGRRYFHGGVRGLGIGDILEPSSPHVTDGCPVCVARASGRVLRVGEYRRWLRTLSPKDAAPILAQLVDAPDDAPIDPPSALPSIYITTDPGYARWYAARSQGDLYRVVPLGALKVSAEDHFPTWTVPSARIVAVIERDVQLTRRDRRVMQRRWKVADRQRLQEASSG